MPRLTIDADYVSKLRAANVIGFSRPPARRHPILRYYTVNVIAFRNAISALVTPYLRRKLYDSESTSIALADAQVAQMAPVIADACMSALYSKLHTIHAHFQTYAGRFAAPPPSYTDDIQLPLPLADAIQNFGVFSPQGTIDNFICVPVYPENVQNEGRSAQIWPSDHYKAYLPNLEQIGIPVRSVETRMVSGTPWWTYKSSFVNDHFDLRCIFSPINYSDHSAILAAMFVAVDGDRRLRPIITHLSDDQDYPVRLRQVPDGYQLRAFGALCHAPCEEWN